MFEIEQKKIEKIIIEKLKEHGYSAPVLKWANIPFSGKWGISTSFFQIVAQAAKQDPSINVEGEARKLAVEIAHSLNMPEVFEKIESLNGYLNLYFSTATYAQKAIDIILSTESNFGMGKKLNQQVMVEFSQPNTHKAFHVGHLRSAILGDSLARILEFAGYDVIRVNYPGDMGLHVIKWLWNYIRFHNGEKPLKDTTRWMGDLYAEANRRLEENPELETEVRELYVRWDKREDEIVKLWERTRKWSLDGFNEMYSILGITFDRYYFNSEFEHAGRKIVEQLIAKNIAIDERPDGAVIVKLDELLGNGTEKYRVLVVLRSDNTALYATEDLALAQQKFLDYPALTKSYYVVDVRQSLHFQQVFKTLEIYGFERASDCQHIPYEVVNLPGNVIMASRDGNVVLMEELIREATSRALAVVNEKNPELVLEQKNAVAHAVAIGSIRYPMLARENTKVVTFDWEAALSFDGQSAPYIQYAFVRASSILRKFGNNLPPSITPDYELTPSEVALIELLSQFPATVQRAAKDIRPLEIANLAYNLAKAFNDFYTQCPVLQVNEQIRNNRIRLVAAARQVIQNTLGLMGITAPKAM
jgi:arginyl-tRNA synthetase